MVKDIRKHTNQIILQLSKDHPDPKCELFYKTQFQLLISVVLSAQTTDKAVNKYMQPVYEEGFTPEIVVAMGEKKVLSKIKSIGLAPTKSKRVVALSKILIAKHKSRVPKTREALEELPGVGRKTASVILGELFGHPTIAVDTHVFRVSKRLGLHDENTADKCEQVLLGLIDPKHLPKAHHLFILHGRYTCKARSPDCSECRLYRICNSEDKKEV